MNCERIETQLLAYMDGRATPIERAEVETHLAACAACRARVEEFRALWTVLDEAPAHELSPAFDARLRQRIAAEAKPGWLEWLGSFLPQPRLALALGLLLVVGVWIGTMPPPTEVRPVAKQTTTEEDFKMIEDLQVLEDYDALASFEALAEVPVQPNSAAPRKM